jgi:hypothetical protein
MTKALIASACGLLLVFSGCGSDNSAKKKTACAQAAAAMTAYHKAGQAVGANIDDTAGLKRVIAAAAVFRQRLGKLEPLASAEQRKQLEELTGTLEQHENLLGALAVKNTKLAHQFATPEFEPALDRGQAYFRALCKVPAEP